MEFIPGLLMVLFLLGVSIAIYMIPSFVAKNRGHKQVKAIITMNICLGWTVLGWALALTWAMLEPGDLA